LYARFQKFSDPRKAQGKRYNLTTMLVIIFKGKLRGKDRPMEITDWAKNQAEELSEQVELVRTWIPHYIRFGGYSKTYWTRPSLIV
jgi:hypothetical protein